MGLTPRVPSFRRDGPAAFRIVARRSLLNQNNAASSMASCRSELAEWLRDALAAPAAQPGLLYCPCATPVAPGHEAVA